MRSIPLITVALPVGWGGPLAVSEPGVHEIAVDARLVGGSVENDVENNRRSRTVVFLEAGR